MLIFHISYAAHGNDTLFLNIHHPDGNIARHAMRSADNVSWSTEIQLPPDFPDGRLTYHYSVVRQKVLIAEEWVGHGHAIDISRLDITLHTIHDRWISLPEEPLLHGDDFALCLNMRQLPSSIKGKQGGAYFRVKTRNAQLKCDERLMLIGEHPILGEWDSRRALPCHEQQHGEWYCDIPSDYLAGQEIVFKFVAISSPTASCVWECGDNRTLALPRIRRGEVMEYELPAATFDRPLPRLCGTSIPECKDLRAMIDWAASTCQHLLQVTGRGFSSQQIEEATAYARSKRVLLKFGNTERIAPLAWWDKDREKAEEYYQQSLLRHDAAPHPLPSWLAHDIIFRQLKQPAVFSIIHIEDWLCLSRHHKKASTLYDSIAGNVRLSDDIAEIIRQSDRTE